MVSRKRLKKSASDALEDARREVARIERYLAASKSKKAIAANKDKLRKAKARLKTAQKKAKKARQKRLEREKELGIRWPKRAKRNKDTVYAVLLSLGWQGYSDGVSWDAQIDEPDVDSIPLSGLPVDFGVTNGVWWGARVLIRIEYQDTDPHGYLEYQDTDPHGYPVDQRVRNRSPGTGGVEADSERAALVVYDTAWHGSPGVLDETIASVIDNVKTLHRDAFSVDVVSILLKATGRDSKPKGRP